VVHFKKRIVFSETDRGIIKKSQFIISGLRILSKGVPQINFCIPYFVAVEIINYLLDNIIKRNR
jgi:hypothetical protein